MKAASISFPPLSIAAACPVPVRTHAPESVFQRCLSREHILCSAMRPGTNCLICGSSENPSSVLAVPRFVRPLLSPGGYVHRLEPDVSLHVHACRFMGNSGRISVIASLCEDLDLIE
jgi:hypothetical protein